MNETPVLLFFNKLADLILLNFLWLVGCIPLITIGASTTAMYHTHMIAIRQGDGYVMRRFIQCFKKDFWQATILELIMVGMGSLLIFDLIYCYSLGTVFGKILFCLSSIMALLVGLVGLYVYPVLSKFENTLLGTLKTAAAFAIGYLPYTVIIAGLTVLFIYGNYVSLIANGISIFIGVALISYIKSFFFYRVFMHHMDERYDDFYVK